MSIGAWGRKVGMTQVFDGDRVVPVTAIDVSNWVVTGVRTKDRDGYSAIQVGQVKARHVGSPFSSDWIKKPNRYFLVIREVRLQEDPADNITIGERPEMYNQLVDGDMVDVSGRTRGRGFAGVVRRHNFNGSPGSHGSTMGKRTGSLSFMCTQGRVVKGKKMPGHMGNVQRSVQKLKVVKAGLNEAVVLVKGAIPGHSGSLVFVRKRS